MATVARPSSPARLGTSAVDADWRGRDFDHTLRLGGVLCIGAVILAGILAHVWRHHRLFNQTWDLPLCVFPVFSGEVAEHHWPQ